MYYTGDNLIFLISQPRAGSTMLQRVLGGHPEIHTLAETWFMLHPCFGIKAEGYTADYELGGWAKIAEKTFFDQIGGHQTRIESVREMARVVYGKALDDTGKRYFLDKTPRYYAIIDELAEIFPSAHFILLFRNPLAVLCSVIRTWIEGHWERMPSYRDDLLLAPECLVKGMASLNDRAIALRYEDIVARPGEEVSSLCDKLDISYDDSLLDYGQNLSHPLRFGDPNEVPSDARPTSATATRWTDDLADPRTWRLASDYLNYLGPDLLAQMGYDHADLAAELAKKCPGAMRRLMTPGLTRLVRG